MKKWESLPTANTIEDCFEDTLRMQVYSECLFANDGALLASTRSGTECAVVTYQQVIVRILV